MLFSIIIPVYNASKYIEKCLYSILSQDFCDYEIIIIDDGSTDSSESIIKKYSDKRIKYYYQHNQGVSKARNNGKSKASGEYVLFVDSDDELARGALRVLSNYADGKVDVVVFPFVRIDNKSRIMETIQYYNYDSLLTIGAENKNLIYELLVSDKPFGLCCNFAVRKKIIDDIYFDTNMILCEDLIFDMEMYSRAETIILLNTPLYRYRRNTTSALHTFNFKKFDDLLFAYQSKIDFAKKHGIPINKNILNNWFCSSVLHFYNYSLINKTLNKRLYNYIRSSPDIVEKFDATNVSKRSKYLLITGNRFQRFFHKYVYLLKCKVKHFVR